MSEPTTPTARALGEALRDDPYLQACADVAVLVERTKGDVAVLPKDWGARLAMEAMADQVLAELRELVAKRMQARRSP